MMNDGMLSQDEIDALLNNADDEGSTETDSGEEDISAIMSEIERDALGEIGNISFGSSATTLATLLNQKVDITTPTISVIKRSDLENEFPQPHVGVEVEYTDGFEGANIFVLKSNDAAIIADLMLGGDGQTDAVELNEIHMSAVQEAMNQMMGTAATSMSTVFTKRVDISPPSIMMLDVKEDGSNQYLPPDDVLIKVSFQLQIGDLIDSSIMQLLPVGFAKEMVDGLLNAPTEQPVEQTQETVTKPSSTSSTNEQVTQTEQTQQSRSPRNIGEPSQTTGDIQSASFSSFEEVQLPQAEKKNLDMLLDIPLQVTVELGRTKRAVRDILELSSGSIIELDKLAGEPVDIHVNNKLIAQGEVVVIDENFGVRVTDIVSQSDRLKKLR
ncbi:flagellar motor switch protein FliN/FliY [Natronobacillus azotifigens]|uniref:Flagellar motor switch phosphatase FliY n=1 Tax=Natronobacillus azotifigens TaxID=472978 RepID=A0A9J6RB72_9BACI|nr:flagellar motor switch phosphatase FliY [Natronobacillus azotifigens]MCZ0702572.1 flagellar motor switch phosphatase FliY [Natronobacillus azotifigens]